MMQNRKWLASALMLVGTYGYGVVIEIPEMSVEATARERTEARAEASLAASLLAIPGVTVMSQGAAVGQSDLSIRGSTFSGAGLTLGGIGLTSPQTEHFNADLPLGADLFATPRVRTGFDQLRSGTGHLAGTVELPLQPLDTHRRMSFGGLERGGHWISGLIQQEVSALPGEGPGAGLGVFASWRDMPAVDNVGNAVRQGGGGGRLRLAFHDSVLDAIGGFRKKTFGARGYYGVTDAWDAVETLEYSLLLASWRRDLEGDGFLRLSSAWRRIEDDYTLFWTLPGIFHNEHKTTIRDVLADGLLGSGRRYRILWRISGRDESIRSTNLGSHERSSAQATLAPGLTLGAWQFDAGASYAHFESDPDRWLPQAEVAVQPGRARFRVGYTQTIRQPSYTELNYESPASLGNAGLGNSRAGTVELGVNGTAGEAMDWQVAVFNRIEHDAVDWVRETSESVRWEAVNLRRVRTLGAEAGVQVRTARGIRTGLDYAVLQKSSVTEVFASRYALDYPDHRVVLTGWIPVVPRLALEFHQALQWQTPHALRRRRASAAPAGVACHVAFGGTGNTRISLSVDNLWNDRFERFPGQSTHAPRRASLGMTHDW